MKVLYISHESELNGASKSLLEFVSKIKDRGIHPIVVIPSRGKLRFELDKVKIDTRIVAYEMCAYRGRYSMNDYIRYYKKNFIAIRKIIQIIKYENVDLVHSNSLAVDVGAVSACLAKVSHIWHMREYLKEDFNLTCINPTLDNWLMKRSNCCIAIALGIQKKSMERYGIKAIQLYNGIDEKLYYYPVGNQENKIYKNQLMIAGSISAGKGQWDAIRATEILIKKGICVHLNIVGDGAYEYVGELKKYVKQKNMGENITFMPYKNNLKQLRRDSNAILVCSKMEAFGRVTAEAMMTGKIVIGASSGGTKELIGKHEERGYLYTWNKPEELAEKIEYVLTHPEEVIDKEKRAQKFILGLTDLDAYTDKLKNIYYKILNTDKNRL